jgi:hypothetical protein
MRLQTFSGGVPLPTTGSTSLVFCASFAVLAQSTALVDQWMKSLVVALRGLWRMV